MRHVPPFRQQLGQQQCLGLLAGATVGRVVWHAGGLPAITATRYTLEHDRIVFSIRREDGPLLAGGDLVVAFEVDELDPCTGAGWQVSVVGPATRRFDLTGQGFTGDGDPQHVVLGIDVDVVSGHRFVAPSPGRGPLSPGPGSAGVT